MKVVYKDDFTAILCGDCKDLKYSKGVDAVVTDPPYGLSFMGKDWDYGIPGVGYWTSIKDAMKPGAHLLAFGGTRTHHRLMVAIEDAGFEIRDTLMWVYGSGFPKSHNIGKAVDKKLGNRREDLGTEERWIQPSNSMGGGVDKERGERTITKGNTEWEGWGTALKPAWEPIILARKPLSEKSVADNVLKHSTGGINIDGCRVVLSEGDDPRLGGKGAWKTDKMAKDVYEGGYSGDDIASSELGRFPANFIHDGTEEVVELFPNSKGWSNQKHNSFNPYGGNALHSSETERDGFHEGYNDEGSASRFFYCAKGQPYSYAGKEYEKSKENSLFKQGDKPQAPSNYNDEGSPARFFYCAKTPKKERGEGNTHPTVKPQALMRYLCRLITPPDGVILDPFMGSGSTLLASRSEGFKSIGIDINSEYCDIAVNRWNNEWNT